MGTIEKSVFICYRQTNMPWALAIYQDLTTHDYDVFFDFDSVANEDFEQIILGNIRARAHFLVVLTPSALEGCDEPNDWLRREIETALDEKRNIVPIFLEGFSFGSPAISKFLTGKLENLKKYNGQNVPADFFNEAMARIREKFLNVPLDTVIHPISNTMQEAVEKLQVAADRTSAVKESELTAQEWFEKAKEVFGDYDAMIYYTTKAIRLQPEFPDVYTLRALAHNAKGDVSGAIKDLTEAIRLKPDGAAYQLRAYLYADRLGDMDAAIQDMTELMRIEPDNAGLYSNRGIFFSAKGDYHSAAADYQKYFDLGGTGDHQKQALEEAKKKIDEEEKKKKGKKSFWSFGRG